MIISLVIIMSVTCYAKESSSTKSSTLSDIKGTKYEEAVNKLSFFKIVNGFEDNTYSYQATKVWYY